MERLYNHRLATAPNTRQPRAIRRRKGSLTILATTTTILAAIAPQISTVDCPKSATLLVAITKITAKPILSNQLACNRSVRTQIPTLRIKKVPKPASNIIHQMFISYQLSGKNLQFANYQLPITTPEFWVTAQPSQSPPKLRVKNPLSPNLESPAPNQHRSPLPTTLYRGDRQYYRPTDR